VGANASGERQVNARISQLAEAGRRWLGVIWRLAVYFGALAALALGLGKAASFVLHAVGAHFSRPNGAKPVEELILGQLLLLAAAAMATGSVRLFDRGAAPAPLLRRRAAGRHFVQGSLWGLGAFGALIGFIALFGGYRATGIALRGPSIGYYALLWAAAAALNGLAENLALLGYPLRRIERASGIAPAIVVMSAMFSLAHLDNVGENPLGLASLFLIAAALCAAIYLTGDLWLSIGIHCGGVFAEDFVFSTPDSGVVYTGHLLKSAFQGPDWLTGGAAGPEASLVGLPVFGVFLLLLWLAYRRRPAAADALAVIDGAAPAPPGA
jgi:membrane protease YdiL (CAAX protease family)